MIMVLMEDNFLLIANRVFRGYSKQIRLFVVPVTIVVGVYSFKTQSTSTSTTEQFP